MTKTPTPASHAVNTAPISADLRGMDDAGAQPVPITLMTEDHACKWAWDQVREDVGTEGWTVGESCTFYGFFLWGWNYRGQYEAQRPAAQPARECLQQSAETKYPPLPEPVADWVQRGSVSVGGGSYGREIAREGLFTAEQMRAYADAALQAAPPAPEAWMDPLTQDVINDARKRAWLTDFGAAGANKAAAYTVALGPLAPAAPASPAAPAAPAAPASPASQDALDAPIVWPKARDVGRTGDMSPSASLRVGLDGDNDTYVTVWDENGGGSIEFCTPGAGGGKSSRTRVALLALMVAMEADNAKDPGRDWWARRNGCSDAARAAQQAGGA